MIIYHNVYLLKQKIANIFNNNSCLAIYGTYAIVTEACSIFEIKKKKKEKNLSKFDPKKSDRIRKDYLIKNNQSRNRKHRIEKSTLIKAILLENTTTNCFHKCSSTIIAQQQFSFWNRDSIKPTRILLSNRIFR